MNRERVLGNNIKFLLNQKNDTIENFAQKLGFSVLDVQKLCDARLWASGDDVNDIAKYFNIAKDELYKEREFSGKNFLHCMTEFKRPESKEKILDIFDMYCNIREIVEMQ